MLRLIISEFEDVIHNLARYKTFFKLNSLAYLICVTTCSIKIIVATIFSVMKLGNWETHHCKMLMLKQTRINVFTPQ